MSAGKFLLITAAVAIPVAIVIGFASRGRAAGGKGCGRLVIGKDNSQRLTAAMPEIAARMDSGMPAIELYRAMFREAFPSCPFANDTEATVVFDGSELPWQQLREAMRGRTIGDILAPFGMQREGASDDMTDGNELPTDRWYEMLELIPPSAMERLSHRLSQVPVPYVPRGRKPTDNEHFWKWGTSRIRTFRVPDHDGWLWEMYYDDDMTESFYDDVFPPSSTVEQYRARQRDYSWTEAEAIHNARLHHGVGSDALPKEDWCDLLINAALRTCMG